MDAAYDDFVRRHGDALLGFAERLVSGASGVDAADALQDALIRLWGEWKAKPELDEGERRRHAWRLVRSACLDAIKKWLGRGSARGRVRTADIERAIDAADTLADGGYGDRELLAINRAAIADPYEGKREQLVLGPALAAAFAALRADEAQVWLKTAAGASQAEVARDLDVSVDVVNNLAREARDVVRPIIRHSLGVAVDDAERARLYALLDGQLKGYKRRVAERHLAHCEPCQRLAALERDVERTAARVFAPIPLLAVVGSGVGGASVTSTGVVASTGAGTAGGGGFSGALAGVGAKAAAGLALIAVAAGGAVGVSALHHKAPARAGARARVSFTGLGVALAGQALASERTPVPPSRHLRTAAATRRRARHRAASRPGTAFNVAAAPPPAPAPIQAPSPQPAQAPPPQPAAQPAPSATPAVRPQPASGGEFVLGGR